MDIESIITKIKKLFALAEGNANENERDQAMVQAYKLLAQYNLDLMTVEKTTVGDRPEEISWDLKLDPFSRAVVAAMCALYYTTFFMTRIGRRGYKPVLIGTIENITVTKEMTLWMLDSIRSESERVYDDRSARRSFRLGAAHRLMERVMLLMDQERQAPASGRNELLVIRNSLEKQNEDHLAAKKLKRAAPSSLVVDGRAYEHGQIYANSIPVSRDRGQRESGVKRIGG